MRKLSYIVNGLEFSTMEMANRVAKSAGTKPKRKYTPISEIGKRLSPEIYAKRLAYIKNKKEGKIVYE